MTVDLKALDAANAALQKDTKATVRTRAFAKTATAAAHALATEPAPVPVPDPVLAAGLQQAVADIAALQAALTTLSAKVGAGTPTAPTTTPTGTPISTVWDPVSRWGFDPTGMILCDDAWKRMLAELANPDKPTTVQFPPGVYRQKLAPNLCGPGVDFLRIIGHSPPVYNQAPNPKRETIFALVGGGHKGFDVNSVGGTLQSGVYLEFVNLVNGFGRVGDPAPDPDAIALTVDQVNNWHFAFCGWQGWGEAIRSVSTEDNAHGDLTKPLMNVPAGKVGINVVGGDAKGVPGAGFAVHGGSISGGGAGSLGIKGGPYSDGLTLDGDLKLDGCFGGAIRWYGQHLLVDGVRVEQCGTSTQYQVEILHDPIFKNSGKGNILGGLFIVGHGFNELFGRFGPGTSGNRVGATWFENGAPGPGETWVDEGSYNVIEQPQTNRAPA